MTRGLQNARRSEQHRRVRVVAAGVHLAGDLRREWFPATLGQRQRVHVGAQTRDLTGQRATNDADDAGFRDAPVLDVERGQLAFDDAGRSLFLETEFGKAVDVAPDLDRARGDLRGDHVKDRLCHGRTFAISAHCSGR